ncbi:hypothetical protein NC99_03330 [Sunxiuqinia dokdonensis]|uniref:Cadherin domain-containing protein n=2 Tax=Sunxiuqinia dokdonensis TaxID=1409788 RepID=A0A0L8VF00_9BACT|nr:hypothetical protein NC99_03330 [Sunxiuqinia dokdonensis]
MRGLILIVFLLLPGALIAQTSYYVSSSEGNDSNSGTTTGQAWKSLEKVNSFKPQAGDKILFKRGDEWVGTLTPPASGSAGKPITYGAYGSGDKPKIYGSQEITGWSLYKGNIYKAKVESDINQLFLDGEKMKLARYPDSGYSIIDAVGSKTNFTDNSLPNFSHVGATFICRTNAWGVETKTVVGGNHNQNLSINSAPLYPLSVGDGYFLANKLEYLTAPQEFYFDTNSKTVYLWTPTGESPANYSIRGSYLTTGMLINNRDHIVVENLDLLHASDIGLSADYCEHLTINNVGIHFPEAEGLRINHDSNGNYQNNYINGASNNGIWANTSDSKFLDNRVYNTALLENLGVTGMGGPMEGVAIYNPYGRNNIFRYNRIENVGYIGIRWDTPNTIIDKNYIKNVCLVKDDGGAIYTWTSNYANTGVSGSSVTNNIVLYSRGTKEGGVLDRTYGYGIYMDNNIKDVLIQGNTIAYSGNGGIYLHENGNITVDDNTILDALYGIYSDEENENCLITRNIVYVFEKNFDNFSDTRVVGQRKGATHIYNNNKYYSKHKVGTFRSQDSFLTFENWKSATGQDANSTFDGSPLADGEKEELFYNATKQTKAIDLGSSIYRDLDGKEVAGSISLEPFTSQILIKTTKKTAEKANQAPEIHNQSFDISSPKDVNDLIGQIIANDADAGQELTYTILEGNGDNQFALEALTGDLLAIASIPATTDQTLVLTVQVTDNASSPLSASAEITIRINAIEAAPAPDTTSPMIASFSIPSNYSALTIPISELTASDNTAVVGYQLTETATTPTADDSQWTTSAPETYTFSAEGTHTLYAWAKDDAGNISSAISRSVSIALPDLSPAFSEYLFEEPAGATVVDSQGSNDGTLMNEELRVEGVNGDGLKLTGTGHINLGNSFGANVQDELTLSAWIQPQSISTGYQGIIMHGGPNTDTYALYIHPGNQSISFKTSGTTSAWTSIPNIASLWDGNWHHLAVSYDGSKKIIYLDGEILFTVDATGSIESGEGYNLLIGAGRDDENPTLLYEGLIDEVRIYNTALTDIEISELYNRVSVEPNQAPEIQAQSFAIAEPKVANELVGKIVATDADVDQTLSYTLTAGNTAGLFKINPETGEIFANTDIPANADESITLQVQVTDNHQEPLSATAEIHISIQAVEVNQSPVAQNLTVEVEGNFEVNDIIGKIIASDPDAGQLLTYSITGGNAAGLFAINSENGEIRAAADFITTNDQTVVLTVEVKDNGEESLAVNATATINIKGIQINQSPVVEDQTVELKEEIQTNDFILQVVASDPDTDQQLTYAIIQGNEAGLFKINPETGEIFANASIPTTIDQSFLLVVQVTDNAENSLSAQADMTIISLKIAEINQSPVAQNLTVEVEGNFEMNDIIGKIDASDPDAGQVLTYSITGGNAAGLFTINSENGEIRAAADFITTNDQTVVLTVEVKDNGEESLAVNATATINIKGIQLNQSPVIEDQTVELKEEIQTNDFILQVVASDPDVDQQLTYAIVQGNEAGLFKINPETGEIFANTNISATIDQLFSLMVQVTDNGENPLSAHADMTIISLKIVEINQSPVAQNLTVDVEGNFEVNDFIGKIVASDPDAGQLLTYAITGGNAAGLFTINSENGEIRAAADFITTNDQTVVLTVEVKDNGEQSLSVSATASINIKGIQLNQSPAIADQSIEIDGDLVSNQFIGQILASDPDAGQQLTYSIVQGNESGLFKVNPETGEIFANQAISFESNESLTLVVQVTDDHQMPLSAHGKITIHITPAFANQSPVIADQSFEIRKNNKLGDMIGQVLASDSNLEQSLTFAIVSGNEEGLFTIDPATGGLYATDAIQLTTSETVVLEVEVTDNAMEPLSASAYITINIVINGKIVNGEVKNNNPKRIILAYSEPLETDNLKSAQISSDFTLSDGNIVRHVSIKDNEIYLDLEFKYEYEDEIIVSYSRGATPIYDASGNEMEPFDNYEVTNNVLMGNGVNTSIDPTANALDVMVYPNPSNGQVNVRANNLSSDDCELFLFSMTGNLVSKQLVSASFGNLEERLDLSNLNKGTYIIKLISKRQIFQDKIVIM